MNCCPSILALNYSKIVILIADKCSYPVSIELHGYRAVAFLDGVVHDVIGLQELPQLLVARIDEHSELLMVPDFAENRLDEGDFDAIV